MLAGACQELVELRGLRRRGADVRGRAGDLEKATDYVNALTTDGIANDSHLHDPRVDALLNRAERTSGLARAFAYAHVDHVLVHDVVPWITYANESQHNFFSARVGCQVYQSLGSIVLGALCIRTAKHQ